jgi:hypothetical protein
METGTSETIQRRAATGIPRPVERVGSGEVQKGWTQAGGKVSEKTPQI